MDPPEWILRNVSWIVAELHEAVGNLVIGERCEHPGAWRTIAIVLLWKLQPGDLDRASP